MMYFAHASQARGTSGFLVGDWVDPFAWVCNCNVAMGAKRLASLRERHLASGGYTKSKTAGTASAQASVVIK